MNLRKVSEMRGQEIRELQTGDLGMNAFLTMKPPRGKPRGIHRIQPSTLSTIGNLVVEAWST